MRPPLSRRRLPRPGLILAAVLGCVACAGPPRAAVSPDRGADTADGDGAPLRPRYWARWAVSGTEARADDTRERRWRTRCRAVDVRWRSARELALVTREESGLELTHRVERADDDGAPASFLLGHGERWTARDGRASAPVTAPHGFGFACPGTALPLTLAAGGAAPLRIGRAPLYGSEAACRAAADTFAERCVGTSCDVEGPAPLDLELGCDTDPAVALVHRVGQAVEQAAPPPFVQGSQAPGSQAVVLVHPPTRGVCRPGTLTIEGDRWTVGWEDDDARFERSYRVDLGRGLVLEQGPERRWRLDHDERPADVTAVSGAISLEADPVSLGRSVFPLPGGLALGDELLLYRDRAACAPDAPATARP